MDIKLMRRYEKQLRLALGEQYLEKIISLRQDLKEIMVSQDLTAFDICLRTGLNVSTMSRYLNDNNKISLKTYNILKNFLSKRKKKES